MELFLDVNENTGEIQESYLSKPLLESSGINTNPYTDEMQGILTITTDKLIPTKDVKNSSFNPELKNGVDISYYARFYVDYDFEFYIIDKKKKQFITDYGEIIPYLENHYHMILT